MSNKELKANFVVYCHTSPSGKKYIGVTNNYKRRCNSHRHKSSSCTLFSRAIHKYGWNNFSHNILATGLTIQSANHFEQFYIKEFNTIAPDGYNLLSGGNNFTHSEESKQKMSESSKGENHPMFGKKHSPDTIEKMIAIKKGKKRTSDTKDKIRLSLIGRKLSTETKHKISEAIKGENHHFFGKKLTPDHIAKMSEAQKGEKSHMFGKFGKYHHRYGVPLTQEHKLKIGESQKGENNVNFGKFGKDHPKSRCYKVTDNHGISEIIFGLTKYCKDHGLQAHAMSSVATGKRKHHKGYKCEYCNELQ